MSLPTSVNGQVPIGNVRFGRIAASGFPTSKEDEDLIHQALRGRTRARVFRDNSTSPEWIAWLDKMGLSCVGCSNNEEFNWLQSTLSYWVAHYPLVTAS